MNCVHCNKSNPDNWFYCRKCGKRASETPFTTNMYMMSDIGKRTDIEVTNMSMEDSIKDMNRRNYAESKNKIW